MPIIDFPPTFDFDYVKNIYPEFKILNDDMLAKYCKKIAVEQGRSTCPYDRREALKKSLQDMIDRYHAKVLEISPWDDPFFHGESVKYFDVADSETLRKNLNEAYRTSGNVPEKIHFVSPNCDLGVIDEKFDIVFSAHVIEHVPDLVAHFQAVSKILNAGGLYILIVPDKRFCFDHYNAESTLAEVIDAFFNERKNSNLASVINSAYTITHNSSVAHWLGFHGERFGQRHGDTETWGFTHDLGVNVSSERFWDDGNSLREEKFLHMIDKYIEATERGEYINAHNWRFTPDSFGYIVNMLNKLNFIDFPLYRLCHTIWGRSEFIAILEKN